jgi:UDP:flavonoid glycosyltransferase YjiC (YdhE family)
MHGGAGTFLGTIAAGGRSLVRRSAPKNARSLVASKAGIAVFDTDPASLRNAIEQILIDKDIKATARQVAAEIAAMPHIEAATDELLALAAGVA